jgi:hypothetical protein
VQNLGGKPRTGGAIDPMIDLHHMASNLMLAGPRRIGFGV